MSSDNRAENLEWTTQSRNINYGTRNMRVARKLSKPVLQYTLDGQFVKRWVSAKEAGRNGFLQSMVSKCCRGERGKHHGYLWRFEKSLLFICPYDKNSKCLMNKGCSLCNVFNDYQNIIIKESK